MAGPDMSKLTPLFSSPYLKKFMYVYHIPSLAPDLDESRIGYIYVTLASCYCTAAAAKIKRAAKIKNHNNRDNIG